MGLVPAAASSAVMGEVNGEPAFGPGSELCDADWPVMSGCRAVDRGLAEHPGAVVDDHRLAGGNTA